MLGLANSHDTAKKIAEAVLEENQEALQKCLKALAELGYAKTANRERADRPSAKKHHKMITAVTPKASVSQMQAANVIANETPAADPEVLADAAEDSDTELFAELDKGLMSDDSDS
ncbi:hypothetical protein WJX77_001419 [Trebouxia sp. C0004]